MKEWNNRCILRPPALIDGEPGSNDGMTAKVAEEIAKGWVPQGGVSVCSWNESWENLRKGGTESANYMVCAQAMIYFPV